MPEQELTLQQLLKTVATEPRLRNQVQDLVRDAMVLGAVIHAGADCMVTGREARRILGDISRTHLYRLVKRGEISEPVHGRYVLSEIQDYIARQKRLRRKR
jgi:hypothetical protein